MKTLLFTLEYPPFHGGVANYYGSLVKYWPKASAISVLNNNEGRLIKEKLPGLKWLPAYFLLSQKIKQEKIDHILVGHILPLGTVAYICSRFCRIKYSVILHGLDFTSAIKSGRKKFISKLILSGADKIICANSYTAKLAGETFSDAKNKITVVNPGAENPVARPAAITKQLIKQYNLENKIILLSVGRLIKRKGFDKVIEALPKIMGEIPNLVYIIIGLGPELDSYQRQIVNLGLKNQVIIINQATDEERNSWYEICNIFIMAAENINGDFEGFGTAYLEANLAGIPVIAGRSGGVGDAVVDGLNGILIDPVNPDKIASAVIKLAGQPELRKKLGEQGKKRAIKEFNWLKQAEKIYNIIM